MFAGVVRDITERVRVEEVARKSLARFQELFDSAPDALLKVDGTGEIVLANGQAEQLFGYPREQLLGQRIETLIPERLRARHVQHREAYAHDPSVRPMGSGRELWGRRSDGAEFPVEVSLSPVTTQSGRLATLAAVRDITDRHNAARALATSLAEKEVLLREVHHRVKNNLQVISSMLSLQGSTLEGSARFPFEEAQNRVRAMALVHEKLYRGDLDSVDVAEYLRDLTSALFQAHRVSSSAVQLVVQIEDVAVAIEVAVPLGLIVNELVSNALKHAFPHGRKGTITVAAHQRQGAEASSGLVVADDGIGLPPGFRMDAVSSLGLRLVPGLVGQLGGELHVDSSPSSGTIFTISLKRLEK